MEYNFRDIEKHWRAMWVKNKVYKVANDTTKPKYYVLDMFPYPSGAGLHVGHPLGYIASDIYARYKKLCGFNVLHPMGFDDFGLPAEQYAIETGQHPAITTEKNIARYREQLDNIGFCYDWDRQVRTSDPEFYKWTQWIFLQLFHSWYNRKTNKTSPITELVSIFEREGNSTTPCPGDEQYTFSAADWTSATEKERREILMKYRLAYQGYAQVWWCEALGTVLANDEVVNGVSERGSHPVERKNMRQWFLRITEFADRLLEGLDSLDWSEPMKEMQRNWIGKSTGAVVKFTSLPPAPSDGEGDGEHVRAMWNTADPVLYQLLKDKQNELKGNQTKAESILWQRLRDEQLGVKFWRQHIIDRFIADFVCLSENLIIEADGKIHEVRENEDAERTARLNELGFDVIRFTNDQVLSNIDWVIDEIKKRLAQKKSTNPAGDNETQPNASRGGSSPSEGGGWGEVSVFTTRPDTIFGVDFLVLAPEHDAVSTLTTPECQNAVSEYIQYVKGRSERERQADVKQVTGCNTGGFVIHPLTNRLIPVWISEYVLAGYGTGAIMGVPAGDERDHRFAKHFNIPITNIFGDKYTGEDAISDKTVTICNSGFLTGMSVPDALEAAISAMEQLDAASRKVNYRLRDAGFSRQRYWGEPFPIIYIDGVPYGTDEAPLNQDAELSKLPVELPMVEHYRPGPEGQGPLANLPDWVKVAAPSADGSSPKVDAYRETNTMPGYAGSSWYFLRYMDPHNGTEFASREAINYWHQVDLYIGGTEHAVGHLLYSRMWTKALCDLGHIGFDEPFKKLMNQGMIQGSSRFVFEVLADINFDNDFDGSLIPPIFISKNLVDQVKTDNLACTELIISQIQKIYKLNLPENTGISIRVRKDSFTLKRVDVTIVDGLELDKEAFKRWKPIYANAEFINEDDGRFLCSAEVEKMSKSKYNVVNPDDIVAQYGADTFRMYEMFLGPVEMSKPWDTKGIEGVHRFLKKLWRLYADEQKGWIVTNEAPTDAELRLLHKTIKKIGEDIERFAFNTSVSQFMITVNELSTMGCHKKAILEPLAVLICPFAPHIAEEIWHQLGNPGSVTHAAFPKYEQQYVTDNSKVYPVAINGKPRYEMEFALDALQADIEKEVLGHEQIIKWTEGKTPKKFIYVKGKMINVVI